jgi:GAF domain-containing protein
VHDLDDDQLAHLEGALLRAYEEELADTLHDAERLTAIYGHEFAGADVQDQLQLICRLASSMLKAPISAINVITGEHQVTVAAVGMELQVGPVDESYCAHVVGIGRPLRIPDATQHSLVCRTAVATPGGYQAYLGVPLITHNRQIIGALCVVDRQPRLWNRNEVTILAQLAAVVVAFTQWDR